MRAYLPSRVLGLEPLPGSVSNQDFMLHTDTGDFVLKVGDRGVLSAEAWACGRIRDVGVVGPDVVAFEAEPTVLPRPFLLMRRMPGVGLDVGRHEAFIEAGRQLRLVHSIEGAGYGFLAEADDSSVPTGPQATWADVTAQAPNGLDELVQNDVITPDFADRIRTTLDGLREFVRFERPGAMLHGDLKPPHVFADGGRYVGLIDWGDVAFGDPMYDLARFSINADEPTELLLRGYELEMTDDLRTTFAVYRVIRMTTALLYELRWGGDWFDSYRRTIEADLVRLGG